MMMPLTASAQPTALGSLLLRVLDALEAEGCTFWTIEESEYDDSCPAEVAWSISFDAFPVELPPLPGEIELLASAVDEILLLGAWDGMSSNE